MGLSSAFDLVIVVDAFCVSSRKTLKYNRQKWRRPDAIIRPKFLTTENCQKCQLAEFLSRQSDQVWNSVHRRE